MLRPRTTPPDELVLGNGRLAALSKLGLGVEGTGNGRLAALNKLGLGLAPRLPNARPIALSTPLDVMDGVRPRLIGCGTNPGGS
jgi:hypothetical protein